MNILLPNPDFLKWLLKSISGASKSITVVNYLATLSSYPPSSRGGDKGEGDPVRMIVMALVASIKRGVAVTVILEGSKFGENYSFYNALKKGGADVWMDTSLTFIHTKAVLIDGKVLCIGSHNLSSNALTRHEEMSIATDNPDAVSRFNVEFEKMTQQRRAISEEVCRDGVKMPLGALVKIKCAKAPYAYLLYMFLLRLGGGRTKPIKVDAELWAGEIGLPKSTASANVRIASILDFLSAKLRLIKYDRQKDFVSLLKPYALSPKPYASLPSTFWQFRWFDRLSVDAIHLYFAGEAEKLASAFAPWWRLKRDDIAAKYGFQKQLVNRAQRELQKFGLMEVLTETAGNPAAGRYVRYMNYFRQNPFYDYDARMKKIDGLSEKYSTKVFEKARKLASLVSDDSSAEKIEALCRHVSKSGIKSAESVAGKISRLAPNSTKRTFEYIEELYESYQV